MLPSVPGPKDTVWPVFGTPTPSGRPSQVSAWHRARFAVDEEGLLRFRQACGVLPGRKVLALLTFPIGRDDGRGRRGERAENDQRGKRDGAASPSPRGVHSPPRTARTL